MEDGEGFPLSSPLLNSLLSLQDRRQDGASGGWAAPIAIFHLRSSILDSFNPHPIAPRRLAARPGTDASARCSPAVRRSGRPH